MTMYTCFSRRINLYPGRDLVVVDATYAAPGVCAMNPVAAAALRQLAARHGSLVGGAAVVRGQRYCAPAAGAGAAAEAAAAAPAGRIVLIGCAPQALALRIDGQRRRQPSASPRVSSRWSLL